MSTKVDKPPISQNNPNAALDDFAAKLEDPTPDFEGLDAAAFGALFGWYHSYIPVETTAEIALMDHVVERIRNLCDYWDDMRCLL